MFRLAIYGKGGIGKSTTTSNVACALAEAGYTVMQIGCDPKADSTRLHTGEAGITTVLDLMRAEENAGQNVTLEQLVHHADDGVWCCEAGGPVPGVGCAGRGIITAFEQLERVKAFEEIHPDIVLYDVLGDVVCGGFAMPLRGEYSDGVMIVTSGEMMSLYAAGNILHAVESFKKRGYAAFRGLIVNRRNIPAEDDKIAAFCREEGCEVIADFPRSSLIQDAEDAGRSVIAAYPESELAARYRALAHHISEL